MILLIGHNKRNVQERCWDIIIIEKECYKLRTLELVKRKNLVLGLTQENSIENSVQDGLPYIQNLIVCAILLLAYSKWLCICFKVNRWYLYCMMSSFQNLLLLSHITCDCCDLECHSNPNLKF